MRLPKLQTASACWKVISIFSVLLLTACVPQAENTRLRMATIAAVLDFNVLPAANSSPRASIQFDGWSISPPPGEHWVEQRHSLDPKSDWVIPVAFFKVLPKRNSEAGVHAAVATVETRKLSEADRRQTNTEDGRQAFMNYGLQFLIQADKANAAAKWDRIISSKGYLDSSIRYDCLRYDLSVESRHVTGFEGRPFYIEFHTYACIDPGAQMIVKLSYGQRVPPDTAPVDLSVEGEAFLNSLKFTSPTS